MHIVGDVLVGTVALHQLPRIEVLVAKDKSSIPRFYLWI